MFTPNISYWGGSFSYTHNTRQFTVRQSTIRDGRNFECNERRWPHLGQQCLGSLREKDAITPGGTASCHVCHVLLRVLTEWVTTHIHTHVSHTHASHIRVTLTHMPQHLYKYTPQIQANMSANQDIWCRVTSYLGGNVMGYSSRWLWKTVGSLS